MNAVYIIPLYFSNILTSIARTSKLSPTKILYPFLISPLNFPSGYTELHIDWNGSRRIPAVILMHMNYVTLRPNMKKKKNISRPICK